MRFQDASGINPSRAAEASKTPQTALVNEIATKSAALSP